MIFFRKFFIKVFEIKDRILILLAICFILTSAFIMRLIEPETFDSYIKSVWWVMVTMTTIGYGDVTPQTDVGKIFAMVVVFVFGIGVFGTMISVIVNTLSKHHQRKKEGKSVYHGKNHVIVIGWTAKSKLSIEQMLFEMNVPFDVVLIANIEDSPFEHEKFHFIQGSPTSNRILDQANLMYANTVMIFSPEHIDDPDLADGYSLLVATAIELYDSNIEREIYTVVEILREDHRDKFLHVKVDKFVLSQQSIARLMTESAMKN